jgi:hypothetical protein
MIGSTTESAFHPRYSLERARAMGEISRQSIRPQDGDTSGPASPAFEQLVQRGEISEEEGEENFVKLSRIVRKLEKFQPLVVVVVKLLAKLELLELTESEILCRLDDRVFDIEVQVAALGL